MSGNNGIGYFETVPRSELSQGLMLYDTNRKLIKRKVT